MSDIQTIMINAGKTLYTRHRELVLYGIIGITGVTIDFLSYALFTTVWGWIPYIATILSVSLGIINNFIWNAFVNFKTTNKLLLRFASFYSVGMFGILISVSLLWFMVEILSWGNIVSKIISIPIIVIIQFFLNKKITFKGWDTKKI